MQTQLTKQFLQTEQGREADAILRSCVHCGFCTATCPTYQLLGDELDGPRGRIYQIKQMLEGQSPSERLQQHLDRCLTCRSCESTCPSGVSYAQLLNIGREYVEQQLPRSFSQKMLRFALRKILPYPKRFGALFKAGQLFKSVLPESLKKKLPAVSASVDWSGLSVPKKILVLDGCVQSVVTPDTNAMASHIFARLDFELVNVKKAGCCGAISSHLSATEEGRDFMRNNIDAWWPFIEQGVEAIISTASGCGLMLNEYGDALKDDPAYADKAEQISSLFKDPVEMLSQLDLSPLNIKPDDRKIVFHSPCTQQHGLKLQGQVENLLGRLGFSLIEVADSHLCCGSAGTYSILQSDISQQLLNNKLAALTQEKPDLIVTANVGCQLHLQTGTEIPIRHWLSLLLEE